MPRRLAITAPHRVDVIEYEDRPLLPGEVRIETELASGKHGTTVAMFDQANFRGHEFDQDMRIFVERDADAPPQSGPRNTGTTGSGVISDVGTEVTRWRIGDRVFGLMDVRETNTCRESAIWELGEIDPLLALCVEPAYVAFHCIRESNIRYGDRVAVIGLGAIGMLAVRMALQAGAEMVIAVDLLKRRRRWAMSNGADFALDPAEGDAALRIHELTDGKGVDVAIEIAGAYSALATAVRAVRVGGTVCSAGFYQGEARGIWLGREWHHNRINIVVPHGCGWGHTPREYPAWDRDRAYDCLVSLMRKGKLTAPGLIDPIVPIEQGPLVFRWIEEEPERVLKYAVRFD